MQRIKICCLAALMSSLVGCNTFTRLHDSTQMSVNKIPNHSAYIYCSAHVACQFERVNRIQIIPPNETRPTRQAIQLGYIRSDGSLRNDANPYFLTLPAEQTEVAVRFYPVSKDKAVTFHMIHNLKPDQVYELRMYRATASSKSTSLIKTASPSPLCVDLVQGGISIRRFCRPADAATGLGEFIEKKL